MEIEKGYIGKNVGNKDYIYDYKGGKVAYTVNTTHDQRGLCDV